MEAGAVMSTFGGNQQPGTSWEVVVNSSNRSNLAAPIHSQLDSLLNPQNRIHCRFLAAEGLRNRVTHGPS